MYRTLFRRGVGKVFAIQQNLPGIGQIETGDHAQEGSLAAAGRAKQGEELARFDIQTDIVHRDQIADAARNVSDFELGHPLP